MGKHECKFKVIIREGMKKGFIMSCPICGTAYRVEIFKGYDKVVKEDCEETEG